MGIGSLKRALHAGAFSSSLSGSSHLHRVQERETSSSNFASSFQDRALLSQGVGWDKVFALAAAMMTGRGSSAEYGNVGSGRRA
jgi:hypothetical protein